MKDRVSLHPGRIKLIPVEGQENTYDLERADEPIEVGTPLNKVNILKDSTIQKYINANLNVPDDVFNYLGNYAEYWWRRTSLGTTKYREKQKLSTSSDSNMKLTDNYYYDSVNVDEDTGEVTVNGTGTIIDMTSTSELTSALKNKYVVVGGTIIHIEDTVNKFVGFTVKNGIASVDEEYYSVVSSESYLIAAGIVSYVHSIDRTAYPDSGDYNGFTYEYVGIPFENMPGAAKIAKGSYVGTGVAGADNPNSLTFDFIPKILFVQHESESNMNEMDGGLVAPRGINWLFFIDGITEVYVRQASSNTNNTKLTITRSDKTISWYHAYTTPFAPSQLNYEGATYHYLAIG